MARALGATAPDLPRDRVIALNAFGLRSRWTLRQADRAGRLLEAMRDDDQRFAQRVAALPLPPHDVLFAYSYAALEALQAARARGALAVVDQIDPGRVEWDLVQEEALRWPDYAQPEPAPAPGYYERAQAEWRAADVTLVNSEWSRRALVQQGADPRRIAVLPLAYEAEARNVPAARGGRARAADRALARLRDPAQGHPVSDRSRAAAGRPAGALSGRRTQRHPRQAQRAAPANMDLAGPGTAQRGGPLYQSADVFCAAHALRWVRHHAGRGAGPRPAGDRHAQLRRRGGGRAHRASWCPRAMPTALAAAITRFVRDPQAGRRMRPACLESAARFSVAAYGERCCRPSS
jgi:hypothetical protein